MDENLIIFGSGILFVILGLFWLIRIKGHKSVCTSNCEGEVKRIDKKIKTEEDEDTIMYTPVFGYDVNGISYVYSPSSSSSYCKYKVGNKVRVFYNPENPNQCYVKGNNVNLFAAFVVLIMGVILVVFGLLDIFS